MDLKYLLTAAENLIGEGGTIDFIGWGNGEITKGSYLGKKVKIKLWSHAHVPSILEGYPPSIEYSVEYDGIEMVKSRIRDPKDYPAVQKMISKLAKAIDEKPKAVEALWTAFYPEGY